MSEFFTGIAICLTAINVVVGWILLPYIKQLRKDLKAKAASSEAK